MSSVTDISLFDALKYKGYSGLTDKGKTATKIGLCELVGGVALTVLGITFVALALFGPNIRNAGLFLGSVYGGTLVALAGSAFMSLASVRLFNPLAEKENKQFIEQHTFRGIELGNSRIPN